MDTTRLIESTTPVENNVTPTDGTSILVIVLSSVISFIVVLALIGLAYMLYKSRSAPMTARDLYPSQSAPGRYLRRGDPSDFRDYRQQQSIEGKLTEQDEHDRDDTGSTNAESKQSNGAKSLIKQSQTSYSVLP